MFLSKIHEQTILEISQGDDIRATAESFLIDRQARELSRHALRFYRGFLSTFIEYCNANSLRFIQEITPDFLRRHFLAFGEKHNPGIGIEVGVESKAVTACSVPAAVFRFQIARSITLKGFKVLESGRLRSFIAIVETAHNRLTPSAAATGITEDPDSSCLRSK